MLKKINKNWEIFNELKKTKSDYLHLDHSKYILGNLILQDMLYYIQIWRQIRGYSSNGQRSHSNNKNNKKNKIILMFRVQQFYKLFGKKRRDIFPTLILAEYTNRLWFIVWHVHWLEGKLFFFRLISKKKNTVKFDPHLLAKNIITGITVKKKKKKHNVAKKKAIMIGTIGLPVLFSLYLYQYTRDHKLPFNIFIPDESRKKMGKKKK